MKNKFGILAGITFIISLLSLPVKSDEIKLGIILGYTGPIESLTEDMARGAEMAIAEVNNSSRFMGGKSTLTGIRADTTCVDAAAATAATERLVTAEKVSAIVGGDCSGVTRAMLENVAMPNGILMISPSATSPGFTSMEDNGLFFRTSPSDARQGVIVANVLKDKGYMTAAMTYTNNDYGKGLADSIKKNFEAVGGTITINAAHEDGKGDYGAEVAALAQASGDILIVAGYLDQGGKGIIQASLDTGAFDMFYLPDGMIGDSLPKAIGPDLNGSIGDAPGTNSPGAAKFVDMAKADGFNGSTPFAAESYDAAALIMMAMHKAKSTDSQVFKSEVLGLANAPGEKIYPGELSKALKYISQGMSIDYVGATDVELVNGKESAGNYKIYEVQNEQNVVVEYR